MVTPYPSVSLSEVAVHYGRQRALHSVTTAFDRPEIVALIGPNGSGKTTLLKLVAGLIEPSSGVVARTDDVTIAYVSQLQEHHRWMPMTVGEVITTGRYKRLGLLRRVRQTDTAACEAAARELGVDDLWSERFTDLSGGQRQRAIIARALASEATCLLMDEPITGLDLASQHTITEVMTRQREAGRTVIFSTHHMEETEVCDRVLLIRETVLAEGPPHEILTSQHLGSLFGAHALRTTDDAVIVIDEHDHHSDEVST